MGKIREILDRSFKLLQLTPPEKEIQRLIPILKPKVFEKGENYIDIGEETPTFAFIETGLVRFFYITYEGKEYNKTFKAENEFIMSYFPIMAKEPSPFAVQAMEKTTLWVGDYRLFEGFYQYDIFWHILTRRIFEYNFILKTKREVELLMYDATTRYKNFLRDHPNLVNRISQGSLALHLGISPVSLNRIIKSME